MSSTSGFERSFTTHPPAIFGENTTPTMQNLAALVDESKIQICKALSLSDLESFITRDGWEGHIYPRGDKQYLLKE